MTPDLASYLTDGLVERVARLEERDRARDERLQRIEGRVEWIMRGLIIVLLTVVANMLGFHR